MRSAILAAFITFVTQTATVPTPFKDGVTRIAVRDSATKAPIAGVQVSLTLIQPPTVSQPSTPVITETKTDQNGRAVFRGLGSGAYTVDIQGFIIRMTPPSIMDIIRITDTQKTQEVEFLLERSVSIRGRVVNPDGAPIMGAEVSPMRITYLDGQKSLTAPTQSSSTNGNGEYVLSKVPVGDYFVRVGLRAADIGNLARTSYYPGVIDSLTAPTITATGNLEAVDIRIPSVKTFRASGIFVNTLPKDAAGQRGGTVSRAFGSIYVVSSNADAIEEPVLVSARPIPTSNPDEFRFSVDGMLPGTYYLYPLVSRLGIQPPFISTRALVTIDDSDVENLRITLEPHPEIRGRVTWEGDPAGVDWQKTQIYSHALDRLPLLIRGNGAYSVVEPKTKEFVFSGFQKGVKFGVLLGSGFPVDSYIGDLRQGGRSLNFDGAVTSDASEGPVEIVVRPQGGIIQGSVLTTSGQPESQANVALVPSVPRRANGNLYRRAFTDASGRFTIQGVAPGEYKAFAWGGNIGRRTEQSPEFIAKYEGRGTTVKVQERSSQTIELRVIPYP